MKTTVVIDIFLLFRLKRHAKMQNEAIYKVINNILAITIANNMIYDFKKYKPVKYQRKRSKQQWHKLHVTLHRDIYEAVQDLRRLEKKSVSLILSEAIDNYLLKHQFSQSGNNTYIICFNIRQKHYKNVRCYTFSHAIKSQIIRKPKALPG